MPRYAHQQILSLLDQTSAQTAIQHIVWNKQAVGNGSGTEIGNEQFTVGKAVSAKQAQYFRQLGCVGLVLSEQIGLVTLL